VKRPVVLLLGPSREAISGVSTHVNALTDSPLGVCFSLEHFQVGSEGRKEGAFAKLMRFLFSPLGLMFAIFRFDASVVHINTSLNAKAFWRDLAYLAVAKTCGARVVYQVHGGALRRFASHPLMAALVRAAMRLADRVVVLSRAELQAFRDIAPAAPVEAIPNGIDCVPYRKYNRAASDPAAPLRLTYIGRLAAGKGLRETIEGLAAARNSGVAAELVIAGGGPEEPRLRRWVREAGIEGAVSFAGPSYGEQKARLLSHSDVVVLASYSEGLPYAVLEAMAAGVVPVVTPVGGVPDVLTEGEHGHFVEVGSSEAVARAICALARDRRGLARMSAACRKRIATAYSIDRVANDFTVLYSRLCASRAPRAIL
jgi:glycosyltransferase involved in cell wall biosynthesis